MNQGSVNRDKVFKLESSVTKDIESIGIMMAFSTPGFLNHMTRWVGVWSVIQVPGKIIRFVAGNDECHRFPQKPILKRRFKYRKLICKVKETLVGVWERETEG